MMTCDKVVYMSAPGQSAPETLTLPGRLASADEVAAALARPQTVRVYTQADAVPAVRLTRSDAGTKLDQLARAWVKAHRVDYREAFQVACERHPMLRRIYGGVEG